MATGLFFSSLTSSIVLAFIATLLVNSFWLVGFDLLASYALVGNLDYDLQTFGIQFHFDQFNRGLISFSSLIYFLGLTTVFLLATEKILKNRKLGELTFWKISKIWGLRFVVFVVVFCLFNQIRYRLDWTADDRYSLAEATTELLENLQQPIQVKVLLKGDFPSGFQSLATETKRILDEFRSYNSLLSYEFINPFDTTETNHLGFDIKKALQYYRMVPQTLRVREKGGQKTQTIFPWALVIRGKQVLPVSLLSDQKGIPQLLKITKAKESLEFQLMETIYHLDKPRREKIAFLRGHGEATEKETISFVREISKKYEVVKLKIRDTILDNYDSDVEQFLRYDMLVVIKPTKPFSDKHKFLIDQYVMRGGKVLWLINQTLVNQAELQKKGSTVAIGQDLNLFDFFFKYGFRVNPNIVLDLNAAKLVLATNKRGEQNNFVDFRWAYYPVSLGDSASILTKGMDKVWLRYAGSVDTIQNTETKKTPLLRGSAYMKTQAVPSTISLNRLREKIDYNSYNKKHLAMGYLFEGKFESAYRNRVKPLPMKNPLEVSKPTKMAVISDGDLILNEFYKGKPLPVGYNKWTHTHYQNQKFLERLIGFFLGEEKLLEVDSKTYQVFPLNPKTIKENSGWLTWVAILLPLLLIVAWGWMFHRKRVRKYAMKGLT